MAVGTPSIIVDEFNEDSATHTTASATFTGKPLVIFVTRGSAANSTIDSVTHSGTGSAPTEVTEVGDISSGASAWVVPGGIDGSATISVTLSSSNNLRVTAEELDGADSASQAAMVPSSDTFTTTFQTAVEGTVTPGTDGRIVNAVGCKDSKSYVPRHSETEQWDAAQGTSPSSTHAGNEKASSGSSAQDTGFTGNEVMACSAVFLGIAVSPTTTPAYKAQGTQATSTNNANLTPAYPATVDNEDLAVLVIGKRSAHTVGTITDANQPPNWTLVETAQQEVAVYWRICDGAEDSDTVTVALSGGAAADEAIAQIFTYSDADQSNPITEGNATASDADSSVSVATFTPTSDDNLIVLVTAAAGSVTASAQGATDPATLTERYDAASS